MHRPGVFDETRVEQCSAVSGTQVLSDDSRVLSLDIEAGGQEAFGIGSAGLLVGAVRVRSQSTSKPSNQGVAWTPLRLAFSQDTCQS